MNRSLFNLCLVEMKERAGFYALGSGVLTLYIKDTFHVEPGTAGLIFQVIYAMMYLATLLGGKAGDKLGRRPVMFAGLVMLTLAYALMQVNFLAGVILLIVGNGAFKPSITVMVNAVCRRENMDGDKVDAAYQWFYLAINIGGLIGPLGSGYFDEKNMKALMFACAYIPLLLATIYYGFTWRTFPENEVEEINAAVPEETQTLRDRCLNIISMIGPLFWAPFHSGPNQITFFIKDNTDRAIGPFTIPTGWFAASNSAYVILFTPLLVLWFAYREKQGRAIPIATKMTIGFLLTGASLLIVAIGGLSYALTGQRVSPLYAAACWLVLTLGELFISPMGNSMFSQYARKGEGGKRISLWFLAICVGNVFGGFLGTASKYVPMWGQFSVLACLPLLGAGIMWYYRQDMNRAFVKVKTSAQDELVPPGTGANIFQLPPSAVSPPVTA